MNIYRALMMAAEGCEIYQDIYSEEEEPVLHSFADGTIMVTPEMVSSGWCVATKWRKTSETRAVTAMREGKRVKTEVGGKPTEVEYNEADGTVRVKDVGAPLKMVIGREWRVLR